ncbi:MAG: 4'-phosphopantetheinyl transferase superfamily protein [Sphingomonadales bacterium]|nr:4'-phosphopantetheinyl transferase superfamily protein [Sphingomonadales bacterium]MDE2169900.1 4'-phosphopantetheinyl transferase superfamily protein [Sphingomonadales bacterium]
MAEPIWHTGPLPRDLCVGSGAFVWVIRLDDPAIATVAQQAPLRAGDLGDLAQRPQAGMRGLRRQLSKLLLARAAATHPDHVAIERRKGGALRVAAPEGWHISVAGHWPHAAIAIARGAVGVDIEPASALPPLRDALTIGERRDLRGATDGDVVRRWTAKEAHAKALGVAAQIDPAHIHTSRAGDHVQAMSREGRTLCHLAMIGDVCGAVAQPAPWHS